MVVDAGAEEADLVDEVLAGELLQVPLQLGFGQRGRDLEVTAVAHALGDVAEQLLDRGDADCREHLLAIGVGEREITHDSARTALYAATSSSCSRSSGFVSRMRISQPSP